MSDGGSAKEAVISEQVKLSKRNSFLHHIALTPSHRQNTSQKRPRQGVQSQASASGFGNLRSIPVSENQHIPWPPVR